MVLTPEEGKAAVALARRSMEAHIRGEASGRFTAESGIFTEPRGVFVTLNTTETGEVRLRGCIGFPYPSMPLGKAVAEAAVAAATEDPRFPPLGVGELKEIVVEVSILTPPIEIQAPDRRTLPSKVRIGTDGLIISDQFRSGLLLPQVATEFGMDSTEFLSQACLKAGLPPDAWLEKNTRIQVFQAEIFAEANPGGDVHRVVPRGR